MYMSHMLFESGLIASARLSSIQFYCTGGI